MKAERSNTRLYNNGGIIPVLKKIKDKGLPAVIKKCLGTRPKQSKYSYEDVITAWIATIYCHGFRLLRAEDTKADLHLVKGLKLPSHDTIGRVMKSLATPKKQLSRINKNQPSRGEKSYTTSEHLKLNGMLIQTAIQMGMLKKGQPYTMDMDATMIESYGKDAVNAYVKTYGYWPMVCMIGKLPVFVSLRSGNAGPMFDQLECLRYALDLLKDNGINVTRVRIDTAGYAAHILDFLHERGIKFVVSAKFSEKAKQVIANNRWTKHKVNFSEGRMREMEATWRTFEMSNSDYQYRMVALRMNKKYDTDESNWRKIKKYSYRFLITNDFDTEGIEIFNEYKYRGYIEQNFETLKNDFGWRIVPFSNINENLVYLILTALANNVYQGLLKMFSEKAKEIKETYKLSTFRKLFIQIIFTIRRSKCVWFGESVLFEKIM